MDLLILAVSFAAILVGAELFTNGIEWFGHKLGIAEGAVGSVLAAVGTALPETTIPLIAILFTGGDVSSDVGVGAVLGAPFMLATLAMFVAGVTVVAMAGSRAGGQALDVDPAHLLADARTFVVAYVPAIAVAFLPADLAWPRWVVALLVIGIYARYVRAHLTAERDEESDVPGPLRLHGLVRALNGSGSDEPEVGDNVGLGLPHPTLRIVVVQVVVALVAIVVGAALFVGAIDRLTATLGVDPKLLALVIAPMATELPEALNGIIWIRRGKDGLALGNITGAMVFQAAIPTSIALVFASAHWAINGSSLIAFGSAAIALASTAVVVLPLARGRQLNGRWLLLGGAFYAVYVTIVGASVAGFLG